MLKRGATFMAGLLTGLLSTGLLFLLIAKPRGHPVQLLPPPTAAQFRVHVAGAVRNPGVYALPPGSRIQQALEAAGGCDPNADLTAINLAATVVDGQQVFVSSIGAPTPSRAPNPAPSPSAAITGLININTADAPELDLLPGIGPSLAQKIIEYRQTHGPFSCVDDLIRVSGIGPSKLEAIRDLVTVQ
ncbi:MAG: ComEA family DNA-binding protein [Anaerolineales bacterium]|jgi:competence protein ComEA